MTLLVVPCQHLNLAVLSPDQAQLESDFQLSNLAHLAPWSPQRPDDYYTPEQVRLRLEQQATAFETGNAVHFAMLDPVSGKMIGTCNFTGIIRGAFQACFLGYALAESHQGRGLMHEALETGIGYMFDELKLHRIMANYLPENARSARVLERLGFEREGFAKAYLNIAGKWQDHVLTALVNAKGDDGGFAEGMCRK
jgi:ribosomal-protein-alanine N-acetyltransferase